MFTLFGEISVHNPCVRFKKSKRINLVVNFKNLVWLEDQFFSPLLGLNIRRSGHIVGDFFFLAAESNDSCRVLQRRCWNYPRLWLPTALSAAVGLS
jgi:hypothetical protein